MDQQKWKEERNKIIKKIKEKGNENLSNILQEKTAKEIANEEKKESWIEIFPEYKSQILTLQSHAQNYLQKDNTFHPRDYFDENIHGNFTFQPRDMAKEILEKYKFKNVIGGGFYVWKDNHWKLINEDNNFIGTQVDLRLQNETSSRRRNNVKEIIANKEQIKIEKEDFKTPEGLIPFQNGVYDVYEGKLKQHKPEYNFDYLYNVEYRPELENKDVEKFIQSIMPNSQANQEKLKDDAAFSIATWKMVQKVPIYYGQGANGKTQWVKIKRKIVGEDAYHKSSARKLQQDRFEMASIVDKQLAYFDEFEDVTNPGELKTLVGDDYQNVREMRKESYTTETTVYPVFAANELPNPKEESDGFYRRWEIIDFKQKFTEKQDDGNPDRMKKKQLEEKFMSQQALDSFATTIAHRLEDLVDNPSFTEEQSSNETRRVWKKKGDAVFQFIDKYLTQGDLPDDDTESTDDWIQKDELLNLVNEYMKDNNNSKIKKHQLTKALDSHPDFRLWTNYRPRLKDGSRPTAYAGIKFDEQMVQGVKKFFTFNAYVTPHLTMLSEIDDWFDQVSTEVEAKALVYLIRSNDDSAPLFELVRELDLSHGDVDDLQASRFLKVGSEQDNGVNYPVFSIDRDEVQSVGGKVDFETGEIHKPGDWLDSEIDSWSKSTQKMIDDLLDKAEENGFSRERIEKEIDDLKSDGELMEPKPGKVEKI